MLSPSCLILNVIMCGSRAMGQAPDPGADLSFKGLMLDSCPRALLAIFLIIASKYTNLCIPFELRMAVEPAGVVIKIQNHCQLVAFS